MVEQVLDLKVFHSQSSVFVIIDREILTDFVSAGFREYIRVKICEIRNKRGLILFD